MKDVPKISIKIKNNSKERYLNFFLTIHIIFFHIHDKNKLLWKWNKKEKHTLIQVVQFEGLNSRNFS